MKKSFSFEYICNDCQKPIQRFGAYYQVWSEENYHNL